MIGRQWRGGDGTDRRVDVIRWVIVAVLCLSPAVRYLSHDIHPIFVVNADTLGAPAFIDSVQRSGWAAFGDWYWPPAPYYFPDFLVYVPLWLVLPDAWLAPAVFLVAQLVATYCVVVALAGGLTARRSSAHRWGALMSFATLVAAASLLVQPAQFLLVSYYRAGTLLVSFAAVAVLLWMVARGGPARSVGVSIAVAVISGLTVLSDPLFLAAAVGPIGLVVLLLGVVPSDRGGWAHEWATSISLAAALGVGATLGYLGNRLTVIGDSTYGPSLDASSPRRQAASVRDIVVDADRGMTLLTVAAVAALALTIWFERRRTGRWTVTPVAVALAVWGASVFGHVAAILADATPPSMRYLQFVYLFPVAVAWPAAAHTWSRRTEVRSTPSPLTKPIAAFALVVVVAIAVVPALDQVRHVDLSEQATPAACLDRLLDTDEALIGISGYWEARVVQLGSDHDRSVAILDGIGAPFRVNAAESWFDGPWSFALINDGRVGFDPPPSAIELLDPDATSLRCGSFTAYEFSRPIDPTPLDQPGDELTRDGCSFVTQVGTLDPDQCVLSVTAGDPGYVSFGGKVPLTPGNYEVALRYRSTDSADEDDVIGVFDLTRASAVFGAVEVVLAEDLFGTGGQWQELDVKVTVPDDGRPYVLEARTITTGEFGFEIDRVDIVNLGAG